MNSATPHRQQARDLDTVLHTWRNSDAHLALPQVLALPEWRTENTIKLLGVLGYRAHHLGMHTPHAAAPTLPNDALLAEAAAYFERYERTGYTGPRSRAEHFLLFLHDQSDGVLRHVAGPTYIFPQRMVQHYFAAQHILRAADDDPRDSLTTRVEAVIDDAHWIDVLKLVMHAMKQRDMLHEATHLLDALLHESVPHTEAGERRASIVAVVRQELEIADDSADHA